MAYKIKLEKNEKLLIARLRSGKTQAEFAKQFGVSRTWYGKLEISADRISDKMQIKNVSELSVSEICLLLRRRNNLSQDFLASELGVSRFWLGMMERGQKSPEQLVEWFAKNKLGFHV